MNLRTVFAPGLLLVGAASGFAIIPDFGPDAVFTSVGMVSSTNSGMNGSGVVIAPNWVITARHVGGTWFNREGVWAQAVERVNHPDADISLLRFNDAFGVWYQPNYANILGQQVTMVGFGATGTAGATGYTITGNAGTRRKANNVADTTATVTFDGVDFFESWVYDLDGPTGNGTLGGPAVAGEGGLWSGDSGGGWFTLNGSTGLFEIVAVNSWIADNTGNGTANNYGDIGGGVQLSEYSDWINAHIVPEPATMAALGLGIAAVLARRRKR